MPGADVKIFNAFAAALLHKEPPPAPPIFDGEPARVAAGLAVYRNNVRTSLSRALGDKFPVLNALVGEDFFKFLAHEYFHSFPPRSQLIAAYGDQLPEFLENFQPAKDYPYLGDVARVEIAWLEAYHAADADSMTPEALIAGAQGDIAKLQFGFHPSLRLISSDFPAASIWRKHQPDAASEAANLAGGENILIARPHREVFVHRITPASFSAIMTLKEGKPLSAAIEAALEQEPAFDPQEFFRHLFTFQIITSANRGEETPS